MKIISFLLLQLYCLGAFAQKGVNQLGVGGKFVQPLFSRFATTHYKYFGAGLQAGFGVTKLGSIETNISYLFFNAANNSQNGKSNVLLLQGGYRSHFLNSGFFVEADGGLFFGGGGNGFKYIIGTVGGGYSFKVKTVSFIDLSFFGNIYSGIGKYSLSNGIWLNGNVMYRFILKKKSN